MPVLTIEVSSSSPSLTIVADIHVNTRKSPLPPPLYDDISARPTEPPVVRLLPGDYVMLFDVQSGSGAFTVAIKDQSGVTVASQEFDSSPQRGQVWYFKIPEGHGQ